MYLIKKCVERCVLLVFWISMVEGGTVMGGMKSSIMGSTSDIARLSLSSTINHSHKYENVKRSSTFPSSPKKLEANDEKRLLDALVGGYDRDVRPVRNATHPIVIQLGITLTQIFDMDEKNQVLTTNVWLDQEWIDELLHWDPAHYNGLETIRLPCERIWLPDIVLYNSADDYTRGYMNSKAMVSYKGKVFWPPPTKFRSTCPVDVTYFPFDDQTCILKLGSWIYDGFQVDVTNRTAEVDLTNYIPNGEWELLEARIVRNVIFYSCCPEPFPDVTITIIIRRKTLYYMYNVVLPCMMMSVLTLLVFCLPPDSGEKIALGVTVLLAFSVFMLAIAEKMPETSESIPLIGIYLTCVMTITSVSIIMTVIVLNCHYRGPIQKEVPPWMRHILNSNVVKHMINANVPKKRCVSTSKKRWFNLRHRKKRNLPVEETHNNKPQSCGYSEFPNNILREAPSKPDSIRLTVDRPEDGVTEHGSNPEDFNGLHPNWRDELKRNNCTNSPLNLSSNRPQEEILRALRQLLAKQDRDEVEKKRLNEWRTIAIAIDRILFWIFFLVTSISSFVFLVVLPVIKRSEYSRNT